MEINSTRSSSSSKTAATISTTFRSSPPTPSPKKSEPSSKTHQIESSTWKKSNSKSSSTNNSPRFSLIPLLILTSNPSDEIFKTKWFFTLIIPFFAHMSHKFPKYHSFKSHTKDPFRKPHPTSCQGRFLTPLASHGISRNCSQVWLRVWQNFPHSQSFQPESSTGLSSPCSAMNAKCKEKSTQSKWAKKWWDLSLAYEPPSLREGFLLKSWEMSKLADGWLVICLGNLRLVVRISW